MMIAFAIVALYLFFVMGWILYIAIMSLKRIKSQLNPFAKVNAYIALWLFGYPWDLVMNLIVCLFMLRVPRDWILTGTLKRIINTDTGARVAVAAWICANLLNQFDPSGTHC